jgi:hypothetical protein
MTGSSESEPNRNHTRANVKVHRLRPAAAAAPQRVGGRPYSCHTLEAPFPSPIFFSISFPSCSRSFFAQMYLLCCLTCVFPLVPPGSSSLHLLYFLLYRYLSTRRSCFLPCSHMQHFCACAKLAFFALLPLLYCHATFVRRFVCRREC